MLGDGGGKVSMISIVSPCDSVSLLSFGSFLSAVYSSNPSHYSLPLYLSYHDILRLF